MTIVGAGVIPAAPVLLAGLSQQPPAELDVMHAEVQAVLQALPPHELLLVFAAAEDEQTGLYVGDVDLGGLSHAELRVPAAVPPHLAQALSAASGLALQTGALPVDLAALVLQAASARAGGLPAAVVPVAMPWRDGQVLRSLVAALVATIPTDAGPVVVLAAGDLSAGHGAKAPRPAVVDAPAWDQAAIAAVGGSDPHALDTLGPAEAQRVVARGWPALVAVHEVLRPWGLQLKVRHYSAPRAVGYLVAQS